MNQKEKKLLYVFLAIVGIGVIAQGIPFAIKSYHSGMEDVEVLKDKISRLKRLETRTGFWTAEYKKSNKKEQNLKKLLYIGQSPDLMAGKVQGELKKLTQLSDIKVDSMSLPDLQQVDDWLLITQTMTFKADSGALMELLQLIDKAKPKLIVSDIQIRSYRTRLNCSIKVIGFSRILSDS